MERLQVPHFILDCSDDLLAKHDAREVIQLVFDGAESSGLFNVTDIKIRTRSFSAYTVGGKQDSFLHVFAWIMEGRTEEAAFHRRCDGAGPDVPVVSMNVAEFEKATYSNRDTL